MEANSKPVALIYRSRILPPSETFILEQARAMARYRPVFAGVSRVKGLDVPADSLWLSDDHSGGSKIDKLRFKLLGPSEREIDSIRLFRPSIVHAHFGPDASEGLRIAQRLSVPLIVTYHGYDATCFDSTLARNPNGLIYLMRRGAIRKGATCFIAVSEFIRERLLRQGFPAERIVVHHMGINNEFFHVDPTVERGPVVLFVGRLTGKKGCGLLLRAMTRVQAEVPEARLVIVGDGELRQELEAQAKATLKNYTFAGLQKPHEVRAWMQRASVFCVPSITAPSGDAEGFGMVFAEAQACGLPVVSFSSGGIPDAVAHQKTGLLAQEGDWPLVAEYITMLLRDKTRWDEFSRAGYARVQKDFNIRKQTAQLEDLYTRVISEWRA